MALFRVSGESFERVAETTFAPERSSFPLGKRGGVKHLIFAVAAVKTAGTVRQRLADYAAGIAA